MVCKVGVEFAAFILDTIRAVGMHTIRAIRTIRSHNDDIFLDCETGEQMYFGLRLGETWDTRWWVVSRLNGVVARWVGIYYVGNVG
jgi:hypothetical protein